MEGTGLLLVRSQQSSLITKLKKKKKVKMKFFNTLEPITKNGCKVQYLNIVPTKYTAGNGQWPIQHWYRKSTNVTDLWRT